MTKYSKGDKSPKIISQEEFFRICEVQDTHGFRIALHQHIDFNTPDEGGRIPLHELCRSNWIRMIPKAISRTLEIDRFDNYGNTSFFIACVNNHKEAMRLLLNTGKVDVSKSFSKYVQKMHYRTTPIF